LVRFWPVVGFGVLVEWGSSGLGVVEHIVAKPIRLAKSGLTNIALIFYRRELEQSGRKKTIYTSNFSQGLFRAIATNGVQWR
jgi:hypothetical protein